MLAGQPHMKHFIRFFSNKAVITVIIALVLALAVITGILCGSVKLSLNEIFSALFGGDKNSADYRIIVYVRLPRVLAALIAGSALAVAGAILQTILDNPLASPGIIGVNAGGGLFYLIAALIFPSSLIASSLGAFAGALIAVLAVWAIAVKTGGARNTIVLAGVAVSSLFTAVIDTVVTLKPDLQLDRLAFSIGGFSSVTYTQILYVLPFFAAGMIICGLLAYDLNVISLGDELASGLGMRVKLTRFFAILCVALLSGAAISIAGLLGFVGLVSPHIVSRLVGKDNRILLPVSAMFGAALTLICDIVSRTAFSPYELPVGILLSFVGVPFFLFLLFKRKKPSVGGAK